ncbi:hypothetical protein C8Q75DRAFT_805731 [Abortiporus biennis]|nr:hypothetical protein C8Q75DRAFT_805731 [Abortiporus biennis]
MSDQRKFREKLGLGEKGFGELIAGFSKLRILEIGAAEEINTLHYLRITKAPLLTLKIAFEWRTVEYEERPHFSTSLLESFAQTLRRLSLKWIYIDFSNIVCRSVHTLTLKNAQQNFSLQSLISSFPSVHTLYVDTSDGISFLFNDKTLKRSYKRNRSVDSTSTWPCLHILAGHLDSLFALGLSSPTFHLRLHGINIVNGARIATLLSDIQPQHLDITFVPHHHEYSITAAQLETVIPSHVASNIKVAIFRILLDSSDGDPMLAVYALTKTLKSPCVILHLSTYKKPDFTVDIDLIAMKVLVENLDIRYLAITALVRHNYYNTYGGKLWRVSPQSTLEVLPRELIVELEDPGSALDTIEKLNSSVSWNWDNFGTALEVVALSGPFLPAMAVDGIASFLPKPLRYAVDIVLAPVTLPLGVLLLVGTLGVVGIIDYGGRAVRWIGNLFIGSSPRLDQS